MCPSAKGGEEGALSPRVCPGWHSTAAAPRAQRVTGLLLHTEPFWDDAGFAPIRAGIILPRLCAGVRRAWSHQPLPTAPRSAPLFTEGSSQHLGDSMAWVAPRHRAPAHPGTTAPTCYVTCKSKEGPTCPTSPPVCEVTLQPLRVTGTCPSTPAVGTRLAALQATHQGKMPPGPPAAWGAGTCPWLPHVHYPSLSKWPVLAGAHGSSRCGVWPSVPSWPRPHQPGPAWPGPVCSCGGGGGCCTRGGHSTPPPAAGFGS